jgi:nitrous oxidase accessory protein
MKNKYPVLATSFVAVLFSLLAWNNESAAVELIKTSDELVAAVRDGKAGATIKLAAATFELREVLELKSGMTLKGAGIDETILTHTQDRRHATNSLPDPEMRLEGLDTDAYLIRIQRDTAGVTISDMTLHGPQLHGAVFAWFHKGLHLHHLRIKDFLWSGVRTFGMQSAKIHDCEFISAGGRWEKGQPGVKGGITGGGIFACWMKDCEIDNNRFTFAPERDGPEDEYYGIKVRQGVRTHVHHNTIETNFSMEFPFENDEDNEIDHNVCHGTISIPKHAGGVVPSSGRTFHIHHNWFKDSYSIEFIRNGVEIDHNLFDFSTERDHGNLISAFGNAAAPGPAKFHNNLVNNPGRGVVWINEVFNNIEIRNNHIVARTTTTPREDGLFGFNRECDFNTIVIKDNRIECVGTSRPLLRCAESYGAVVENNALTNVSDSVKLSNPTADRLIGLEQPLSFACGCHEEFIVDGWQGKPAHD